MSRKGRQSTQTTVEPYELITSTELRQIRESLIQSHADLVVQGMLNEEVRLELEKIVLREHKMVIKGNKDVARYVVRETIGTGVIEEILQDERITDIGYNGSELIVESNDDKQIFDGSIKVTEEYIVRLVNKFANANNKEFSPKNPVFDGRFENVRINAVHSQNTAPESGTTMSLRVVRPRLALTEDNFDGFAPLFMLDFFKAAAISQANMVISGMTGTGKTELHKLITKAIPFDDRIALIEDTPETFMKMMFRDKDIYSWVTSENVGVTPLIKAALRNYPTWIMVTETRGSEAYEMIQAVLSGHKIITSLHAVDARAIPSRFVNMAKMGYTFDEDSLTESILRYFDFGIHIKRIKYKGRVVRYLNEIVAFGVDKTRTVFRQRFVDGVFYVETFELPQSFKDKMEEYMVDLDFPENFKSTRILEGVQLEKMPHLIEIPLLPDGRPDHEKIKEMGTTLDILLGRDVPKQSIGDDDSDLAVEITKDGYIVGPDDERNTTHYVSSKIDKARERVSDILSDEALKQKSKAKSKTRVDDPIDVSEIVEHVRQQAHLFESESLRKYQAEQAPAQEELDEPIYPDELVDTFTTNEDTPKSIDEVIAETRERVKQKRL